MERITIQELSKHAAKWILIGSSLFSLYSAGFGAMSALPQRAIFWVLMAVPIFLLYPTFKGRKIGLLDMVLAAAVLVSGLYLALTWQKTAIALEEASVLDTIMGLIMIFVVLESCRRSIGAALPIIALVFIAYALLGQYVVIESLAHKGIAPRELVSYLYNSTGGIFSLPMGTAATYIVVFVVFGSFLAKSGAGQLFIDLSRTFTGRMRGGSAHATIVSNALMGMISGSPVANVITTGPFVVPLMTQSGYPLVTAAGILAVAATASMFTPPVMGAGAFMIADYLGVSYTRVCLAAIIPAALFYVSLSLHGEVQANRLGLKRLKPEISLRVALLRKGHMLFPIGLLVALLVIGWSPLMAAFWSVLVVVAFSMMKAETRMKPRAILGALEAGSRDMIGIASACAAAGIIVGVTSGTGLGVTFSSIMNSLSANNIYLALVLTMIAALLLGMALPPTAVYIILAALTVPALIDIGVLPLAAHFFVFFFSAIGAITPPVCLAAYAAAGVAKTDPFRTGWRAFRVGLVGYIIPFLFILNPVLLGQGPAWEITQAVISGAIGVAAFTVGLDGFITTRVNWMSRAFFVLGGFGLMIPGWITDLIGLGLVLTAWVTNKMLSNKMRKGDAGEYSVGGST